MSEQSNAVEVKVLGANGARELAASTVLDALEQAGYSPEVSIRLNGAPVERPADTPVQPGDVVVASAPELKGGR